jgi:hypothetical protein
LKGLAPVEEGIDLTFPLSHALNVTFQSKNVKFPKENVISGHGYALASSDH